MAAAMHIVASGNWPENPRIGQKATPTTPPATASRIGWSTIMMRPSRKRKVRKNVIGLNSNDGPGGVAGFAAASASGAASGASSGAVGSAGAAPDGSGGSGAILGLASEEAAEQRVHLHQLLAAHRLVEIDDDPDGEQHPGAAGVAEGPDEIGPGRQGADGRPRDHGDDRGVPREDPPEDPRFTSEPGDLHAGGLDLAGDGLRPHVRRLDPELCEDDRSDDHHREVDHDVGDVLV